MSHDPLRRGAAFDGRYVLEERVDDFGVGDVWRARDAADGAAVLVKLLPRLAPTERAAGRFEALGRALAEARAPGVLATRRHGVAGGVPYLVHEPFAGVSLAKGFALARAGQHLLAPGALANLLDRACAAVAAAHALAPPLVHGGLMPGSIVAALVDGRFDLRVIDFGLARVFGDRLRAARATEYMAPAQEDDPDRAEPADDVFALGSIVMEAVTDRRDAQAGVGTVGNLSAVAKRRADLPAALMAIATRATRIDARQRYADVAALREALAAAWSPGSRPAPDEAPAAPSGVAGVAAEYTSWVRFSDADREPVPAAPSPVAPAAPPVIAPPAVAPPVIVPPAPVAAFVAPSVDLSATVATPPGAFLGETTKMPPRPEAPGADLGATYVVRTPSPALPATQAIEQFGAPAPPTPAPSPYAAPPVSAPAPLPAQPMPAPRPMAPPMAPAPAPYAAPRMYGVAPSPSPTVAPPPRSAGRAVWVAVGASVALLLAAVGLWLATRG